MLIYNLIKTEVSSDRGMFISVLFVLFIQNQHLPFVANMANMIETLVKWWTNLYLEVIKLLKYLHHKRFILLSAAKIEPSCGHRRYGKMVLSQYERATHIHIDLIGVLFNADVRTDWNNIKLSSWFYSNKTLPNRAWHNLTSLVKPVSLQTWSLAWK